jgi:hypothetical protein
MDVANAEFPGSDDSDKDDRDGPSAKSRQDGQAQKNNGMFAPANGEWEADNIRVSGYLALD